MRLAVLHPPGLQGENAGLYWLHVTSLVELLEPLGWSVEPSTPEDPSFVTAALGADVAVIQMLADPETEAIILRRRDLGRPTVYEITDNVLAVGDWLPASHASRSPLLRQAILYHAYLADALQMLVPALAELFAGVNPRRIVLSSHTPYPDAVPPKPPGFVFGWSGSRSHAESLRAAAPAVVELCHRHPEATFAFMGDGRLLDELFGAIPPAQREVHPFGTRDEQARFVGGLHVGIAPMAATPFNATRSDTRVGIFAGHGVAAVLQDAPPHREHADHARIYRTGDELLAILEELFHDRAQVESLARRGREWMERERSPEALAAQRDSAYRALIAERSPTPEPVAPAPADEREKLLEARRLERLGLGDEALALAEGVQPSPVYADQYAELKARVAPARRERYVAQIRSPFRRARLGTYDSPVERSRAVLEHNPYDHFALASTIRWLERDDPESPELPELYERAALVAPEIVPVDRRPERLAPFLPA